MPQKFSDETLLDWVRRRASGESSVSIAADYGIESASVRIATNRVRDDDVAAGDGPGEPSRKERNAILRCYW